MPFSNITVENYFTEKKGKQSYQSTKARIGKSGKALLIR